MADFKLFDLNGNVTSGFDEVRGAVDGADITLAPTDANEDGYFDVSITDSAAASLLQAGYTFNSDDTITLDASTASGAGTHLQNSLKDLQKLNIDQVGLTGVEDVLTGLGGNSISLGAGLGESLHSIISGGAPLPSFSGDIALTTDASAFLGGGNFENTDAIALAGAGIDEVYINTAGGNLDSAFLGGGDFNTANLGQFDTASGYLNNNNIELELNINGDIFGSEIGSAQLSDANAATLLANGLSFAEHDNIAVDASTASGAGTHLQNSLKDLQKLNIDQVGLTGVEDVLTGLGGNSISLGAGLGESLHSIISGGAPLPSFSGDIALTTDASAFLGGGNFENTDAIALAGAGIDSVWLDTATTGNFINGFGDLYNGVPTSFDGQSLSEFKNASDALSSNGNNIELELNINGDAVGFANLRDADAALLLANGLSFATHDQITVDAYGAPQDAAGTHLQNSLKDLQKLNIDQVSLTSEATGYGETFDYVSNGGNFHIGLGGAGESLHSIISGGAPLPSFDGDIALTTDASAFLTDFNSSTDAGALSSAGIDAVWLDTAGGNLDAAFGGFDAAGIATTFDGQSLGAFASASNALEGTSNSIELALNINGANEFGSAQLSDANAATLLANGLSFAEHDNIAVDASTASGAGTHLQNSLKDLQKLNIDQVHAAENISVDFDADNTFTADSLRAALASSLPIFDSSANVTLDFGNSTTLVEALTILGSVAGATSELRSIGIDEFHGTANLSATDTADWNNIFADIDAIHRTDTAAHFEIGLLGGNSDFQDLDAELSNLAGLSGDLNSFTTPDQYGSLIASLQGMGVNDFLIESGKVEISDDLTSALVDSGMLHALPGADIILDASKEVVDSDIYGKYAHLSTNLNTMAALDIDSIDVGTANNVYLDIQDLGLPTGDKTAMDEIRDLLRSLDPAGEAKWINGGIDGYQPDVSLVMSSNLLKQIADSFDIGSTDAADFSYQLSELGINNIAVRLNNGLDEEATILAKASADASIDKLFDPADRTYVPPKVTVIGETDPLHDILDPLKLHKE